MFMSFMFNIFSYKDSCIALYLVIRKEGRRWKSKSSQAKLRASARVNRFRRVSDELWRVSFVECDEKRERKRGRWRVEHKNIFASIISSLNDISCKSRKFVEKKATRDPEEIRFIAPRQRTQRTPSSTASAERSSTPSSPTYTHALSAIVTRFMFMTWFWNAPQEKQ